MEEKQEQDSKKVRELHGLGCRCTYCDQDSQSLFQELLTPEAQQDYLGTVKPQLHPFEGQTKEEAEALLKKEADRRKEFEELWEKLKKQPELKAHFGDSEQVDAEPELHQFVDQSLEDVKELIRKSCEQSREVDKLFEEECPEPHLTFANLSSPGEFIDIRTRFEKQKTSECFADDICDMNPELITLAGLAPEGQEVPNEPILNQMMVKLVEKANKKYKKLSLEWSDSVWDKRLLVNGAPTRIRYQRLRQAYEGLKHVTGKQEAARIVGNLVLKKLDSLFI